MIFFHGIGSCMNSRIHFFILLNEVLEAAGNPFLGSSTLTFLTTSAYEIGLEQETVLLNECWCVSL